MHTGRFALCAFLLTLCACAASSTHFGATDDAGIDPNASPDGGSPGSDADGSAVPGADSSAGDAAQRDAGGDANADAAIGTARITCGSAFCRADQQCNAGTCVTPCAGTQVPGDYATIAAALTALAGTGKDETICLAGQSYPETAYATYSPGKALTIRGPANARVNALTVGGSYSSVTLEGFSIAQLALTSTAAVTVRGVRADTANVGATQTNAVLFDGCSIGAPTQSYAFYLYRYNSTQPTSVVVQNSFIHASANGVYVYETGATASLSLSLVNDTIYGGTTGISMDVVTGSLLSLSYFNDIIANQSSVGVKISSGVAVAHGHNLLFGNTNNYAGVAVDGAGYVKSDPMLDSDAPPAPKVGSPARGSADASKAPASDYWATARGASADIGAVQGR